MAANANQKNPYQQYGPDQQPIHQPKPMLGKRARNSGSGGVGPFNSQRPQYGPSNLRSDQNVSTKQSFGQAQQELDPATIARIREERNKALRLAQQEYQAAHGDMTPVETVGPDGKVYATTRVAQAREAMRDAGAGIRDLNLANRQYQTPEQIEAGRVNLESQLRQNLGDRAAQTAEAAGQVGIQRQRYLQGMGEAQMKALGYDIPGVRANTPGSAFNPAIPGSFGNSDATGPDAMGRIGNNLSLAEAQRLDPTLAGGVDRNAYMARREQELRAQAAQDFARSGTASIPRTPESGPTGVSQAALQRTLEAQDEFRRGESDKVVQQRHADALAEETRKNEMLAKQAEGEEDRLFMKFAEPEAQAKLNNLRLQGEEINANIRSIDQQIANAKTQDQRDKLEIERTEFLHKKEQDAYKREQIRLDAIDKAIEQGKVPFTPETILSTAATLVGNEENPGLLPRLKNMVQAGRNDRVNYADINEMTGTINSATSVINNLYDQWSAGTLDIASMQALQEAMPSLMEYTLPATDATTTVLGHLSQGFQGADARRRREAHGETWKSFMESMNKLREMGGLPAERESEAFGLDFATPDDVATGPRQPPKTKYDNPRYSP